MMKYLSLSTRPAIFIVIPLVVGVLAADSFTGNLMLPGAASTVMLALSLRIKKPNLRLLVTGIAVFLLGMILSTINRTDIYKGDVIQEAKGIPVRIYSVEHKKDKLCLEGMMSTRDLCANVLIQIKDTLDFLPKPGMTLLIASRFLKPSGARKPGGFNYNTYLKNKGIRLISYPKKNEIKCLQSGRNDLESFSWSMRNSLMRKIDKVFERPFTSALVKGITLGFKEDMRAEDRQLYAEAGIGHVFAVSGMHVGMVYLICFPLLFFRNFGFGSKYIVPLLLLGIVWLFVLVSGFTPSAIRAGTMITLFEFGKMFHRRVDKWNILAVTAFVAICLNPEVLYDIGFQFSYLALIGIFFFYSKFSSLFSIKNLILKWTYNAVVLSVAAQLTLLPLSLFYFGNFSPYFWLSSLVAMLVVQVNFVLSFVSLILPESSFFIVYAVSAVDYLFAFLNDAIVFIMKFPFAANYCRLDLRQLCYAYLMIIFLMIMWGTTNIQRAINVCLLIAAVCAGADIVNQIYPHDSELIVYSDEKVVAMLQNGSSTLPLDLEDLNQESTSCFIGNKLLKVVDENSTSCPARTEVLIVNHDDFSVGDLQDLRDVKHLIVVKKIKWKNIRNIESFCRDRGIVFHNIFNELVKIKL